MNKLPSEIAKELSGLTARLGSAKRAAKQLNISQATASRYLRLARLPVDEQQAVDEGKAPIRKRDKPISDTRLPLSGQHEQLLLLLGRVKFIIIEQVADYFDVSVSTARSLLDDLVSRQYISKDKGYLPHVFSLSTKGCLFANVTKPKHFVSGAAIHQYLLRNKIELQMRTKNASATFIARTDCWQRGLLPAVAEHAVEFENEGDLQVALVIIDDYTMQPSRLLRSLTRRHDKEKKYVRGDVVLTWNDVIDYVFVYATSSRHLDNHKAFYAREHKQFEALSVRPIYRYIPPVWGRADG